MLRWRALGKPSEGGRLKKDEFIQLHRLIAVCLTADLSEDHVQRAASKEWKEVALDNTTIDFDTFALSMVRLTDVWIDVMEDSAYIEFLYKLLNRITRRKDSLDPNHRPVCKLRAAEDVIPIGTQTRRRRPDVETYVIPEESSRNSDRSASSTAEGKREGEVPVAPPKTRLLSFFAFPGYGRQHRPLKQQTGAELLGNNGKTGRLGATLGWAGSKLATKARMSATTEGQVQVAHDATSRVSFASRSSQNIGATVSVHDAPVRRVIPRALTLFRLPSTIFRRSSSRVAPSAPPASKPRPPVDSHAPAPDGSQSPRQGSEKHPCDHSSRVVSKRASERSSNEALASCRSSAIEVIHPFEPSLRPSDSSILRRYSMYDSNRGSKRDHNPERLFRRSSSAISWADRSEKSDAETPLARRLVDIRHLIVRQHIMDSERDSQDYSQRMSQRSDVGSESSYFEDSTPQIRTSSFLLTAECLRQLGARRPSIADASANDRVERLVLGALLVN